MPAYSAWLVGYRLAYNTSPSASSFCIYRYRAESDGVNEWKLSSEKTKRCVSFREGGVPDAGMAS